MKRETLILLFIFLAMAQWSWAQSTTFSFEEVDSLQQIEARPTVVFIGTDWCRYCQKMEHTTFQSQKVMELLEAHYYFVMLDAEEKKNIRFNGHDFQFKPTGANTGIHELAEALATVDGQQTYPTVCILNEPYEIVFQYAGFMNEEELVSVLDLLKTMRNNIMGR